MLEAITKATGCTIAPCPTWDTSPLQRWARSGLMALTGPRDAAPHIATLDYLGRIQELAYGVEAFARAAGMTARVDGSVITERAAWLGLKRDGALSANGKCRMIRVRDGWLAVNLPRDDDWAAMPAWLGREIANDDWRTIEESTRDQSRNKLAEDAQLLGLAVAAVGDAYTPSPLITRMGRSSKRRKTKPLVLDLSSLWAGPLCGALLAEAGADVIKIESRSRPDGARFGDADFFDRLNAGKRMLALDFQKDRDILRKLFAAADIVIESARPRVLAQWGFSLSDIFKTNSDLIWVSVTGYGRESARANWVGFGDDVAAAAGLVANGSDSPMFIGDAIADPLAGLVAAASAFACLATGGGFLVDASLFAAATFIATTPPIKEAATIEQYDGAWMQRGSGWSEPVLQPRAISTHARAHPLGADSDTILQTVLA
jgi:crotonobetainyl-CoA:carnitine CoA-transferase CaiB-like acyl-CoA transferase